MNYERFRAVRMMTRRKKAQIMDWGILMPQNFGKMNSFDKGQEEVYG